VTEDNSGSVEGREPGLVCLVVPQDLVQKAKSEEVGPVTDEQHPGRAAADRTQVSSGLQQAAHH